MQANEETGTWNENNRIIIDMETDIGLKFRCYAVGRNPEDVDNNLVKLVNTTKDTILHLREFGSQQGFLTSRPPQGQNQGQPGLSATRSRYQSGEQQKGSRFEEPVSR